MRKNKQVWIIVAYLLLLLLSVPWYWPTTNASHTAGVPHWVIVVLLAGFCAALLTAWNLLRKTVADEVDDDSL
ncbi:MAG: cell shape-determining protein MreD [Planctomycetota bacterium]|jgi:cell shape-determining protein MreD